MTQERFNEINKWVDLPDPKQYFDQLDPQERADFLSMHRSNEKVRKEKIKEENERHHKERMARLNSQLREEKLKQLGI